MVIPEMRRLSGVKLNLSSGIASAAPITCFSTPLTSRSTTEAKVRGRRLRLGMRDKGTGQQANGNECMKRTQHCEFSFGSLRASGRGYGLDVGDFQKLVPLVDQSPICQRYVGTPRHPPLGC